MQDHLRRAVEEEERAVALYPTFGPIRYSLARLLDEDGRPMEALEQYREALRLGELVEREPWSTDRMKVPPLARARCHVRLGERAKALALLTAAPPPTPEELASEWDDLMRPVIEESRKAIITPGSSKDGK